MTTTVKDRAQCVGRFRWAEIQLMEMLARWVPTTPEMEAKVLLGRHIWDCAQHADGFGKRAFELRSPINYTVRPDQTYVEALAAVSDLAATNQRLSAFYGLLLPNLRNHYQSYLDTTDKLMDEPTVRLIETVVEGQSRMRKELEVMLAETGISFSSGLLSDELVRRIAQSKLSISGETSQYEAVSAR